MDTKKHPIPEFITLSKLGDATLVHVRQSQRAKRVAIRICHERVELIIPDGNFKKAQDFLLKKESLIRKKLATRQPIINNSDSLVIFGVNCALKYIDSTDTKVHFYENNIILYSTIDNKAKTLKQFLTELLFLTTKQIVSDISNTQNLQFTKIKISTNKGIWGRCTSQGTLFFNWRLVFVPLETLYYVVVHEMCHLVEMNHSSRFWNLVSNLCPDYKIHKQWLKENSYRLHHYSSNLNGL
jgi:hypothetical protein